MNVSVLETILPEELINGTILKLKTDEKIMLLQNTAAKVQEATLMPVCSNPNILRQLLILCE
jgi:hypothetical protein